MSDDSRDERLTYDEVDLVLRRATELQHGDPKGEGSFTLAEVERLGGEIGLSSEAVRSALVHVRSGAMVPAEQSSKTLTDRLMGPVQVIIQRRVEGPIGEVWDRINAFMKEQLLGTASTVARASAAALTPMRTSFCRRSSDALRAAISASGNTTFMKTSCRK